MTIHHSGARKTQKESGQTGGEKAGEQPAIRSTLNYSCFRLRQVNPASLEMGHDPDMDRQEYTVDCT
jgi:hypothetical protein